MRYIFALFILTLGFAAATQTITITDSTGNILEPILANATSGSNPTSKTILVDRDDDSETLHPCTDAPEDCTLRSAIAIANKDGIPTAVTFADHYIIKLVSPLPFLTESSTIIKATPGQEVHINGNNLPGSVFYITGSSITIDSLRLYGAGEGHAIISIMDAANNVTITNNLIGDDDFPLGNCGQSDNSYAGIYISTNLEPGQVPAWVHGNTIECLKGTPGVGILILTDNTVIGKDSQGRTTSAQQNRIRLNKGFGIHLGANAHNIICNNQIHDNEEAGIFVTNFNNNIMDNILD